MPALISSLRISLVANFLICVAYAGREVPASSSSAPSAGAPLEQKTFSHPVFLSLEARTVQGDAAVGVHLTTPIFADALNTVLLEGYGFEGEGELGILGGGIVYRRAVGRESSVEASVFFEGLRTTDGFSYPQLGAGLGYTPNRWMTLRANGYLPLAGKDYRKMGTDRWTEMEGKGSGRREVNFSRKFGDERAPMRGFDVEVEFRLPKPPRWVDPRLAIGYAYRDAEDRSEVYSGMTARAELHFAKHWVVEGGCRQDMNGAGQEWSAGVRFEVLFGGRAEEEERAVSNSKNFVALDSGKNPVPFYNGKNPVPVESGVVPPEESSQSTDDRANERYLPVRRSAWPTVARGEAHGKPKQGDSHPVNQPPVAPVAADDCCPSGTSPLIFN